MKKIPRGTGWAISQALLVASLFMIGFGAFLQMTALAVGGGVCFVLSMIGDYTFWRCPHCNKYLNYNRGEYCQYCGKKLELDD